MPENSPLTHDLLVTRIVNFLREIGLVVVEQAVRSATFLPGIDVAQGALLVDRSALRYPGDLLHEAGHLAVVPSAERMHLHENVGDDPGNEMGAIAWSYAAAVRLRLSPEIVFHADGYRGGATALIENFTQGRDVGVPILVWRDLTDSPHNRERGAVSYPAMRRWLAA